MEFKDKEELALGYWGSAVPGLQLEIWPRLYIKGIVRWPSGNEIVILFSVSGESLGGAQVTLYSKNLVAIFCISL